MNRTFETPRPVKLRVELHAGDVRVEAVDTDQTTVDLRPLGRSDVSQQLIDEARVEQRGDEILVLLPKSKGGLFRSKAEVGVRITVPTRSSAQIDVGSADVGGTGTFGDLDIKTGSGDASFERAADVSVKTGSGEIKLDEVEGRLDAKAGSGDILVGTVHGDGKVSTGSGDLVVQTSTGAIGLRTGSGDITVQETGDSVDTMTGSGDINVKRLARGELKAKAGSGDIVVGVADGTAVYLDVMSGGGTVRSELDASDHPDGGPTATVSAMTGSGDITLRRV